MAAQRGRRKKKVQSQLAEAMDFVSIAQPNGALPYQQHTRIADGYAVATDGTLTAGYPVATDVAANAHTKTLRAALKRCGEQFTVSQQQDGTLKVKAGSFSASVACLPPAEMLAIPWEPSVAQVDVRLVEGFKACNVFISESAPTLIETSLLLGPNTMASTNKRTILEFWHGIDLPPGMVVPKVFVGAVIKAGLEPVGFGWDGGNAITFHYENGAFLRTQLYAEAWPDINRIMNVESNPWPVPEGLIEALETLKDFSEDGNVYSDGESLRSHFDKAKGAMIELDGLPENVVFNGEDLLKVISHMESIDFTTHERQIFAYGDKMRAGLVKKVD